MRRCEWEFTQATDARGRVIAKVRPGKVRIVLDVPDDDFLPDWAATPFKPLPGCVAFFETKGSAARETLSWEAGNCVGYREEFHHGSITEGSYLAFVTIAAPKLVMTPGGPPRPFVAPTPRDYAYLPAPRPDSADVPLRLLREGLEGVEPASPDLIAKVASKRSLHIAQTPDELRYLEFIGAEANVGGENMDHILVKDPPGKAALLEEFLHGTQHRLGMIKGLSNVAFAEWHVKDFMVRHSKILSLGKEDVAILRTLRDRDYKIWKGIS